MSSRGGWTAFGFCVSLLELMFTAQLSFNPHSSHRASLGLVIAMGDRYTDRSFDMNTPRRLLRFAGACGVGGACGSRGE